MKSSRHAVLAAATLLATVSASSTILRADDQRPQQGQDNNEKKPHGKDGQGGQNKWQQGRPPGQERGPEGKNPERHGKPAFGEQPPQQKNQFDRGERGGNPNPNAFVKPRPPGPPKQPAFDKAVVPQQQQQPPQPQPPQPQAQQPPHQQERQRQQDSGPRDFNKRFGGQNNDQNREQFQKPPGKHDWKQGAPGVQPTQQNAPPPIGNPPPPNRPANNFLRPQQPLPAADAKKRFEALRGQRKEVKIDGGKGVVIEEPGKRRIFRENNRVIITHDDNERLRRVAPNARFEKGKGGTNIAVIDRPGGYKIYSETDSNGQLIRRYRRGPDGRDFYIIDNRRRRHDKFGRNLAAGIGIGVGVVAGAAILNSILDVPPPRVTIPREEYIVDYERASDEDVYDALSAPPVENFRDRYTLDEIRATVALRDRMRRVDLDDITFDFGSWEVNPSEYGKLERIARAMRRIIDRNPNEVFMIEGYTDAVGTPEDNLSLSDRRAESVAEVLTDQFQIPFENLTTQGYGEEYLKVPTQAPERLNRRVAVRRITPLLARGEGAPPPPPPQGTRQPAYDNGPGGPDDGGPDDGGPMDDRGSDGPPPPDGSQD